MDPSLGRGSVSLFAKTQGFLVLSNDVAFRSTAIGRALIANGSEILAPGHVVALLQEPFDDYPRRAELPRDARDIGGRIKDGVGEYCR